MKRPRYGFTIVELVTVMIVVGILAAIAIPRITKTDAFSSHAYRNEIASALRHAQKSAVSHRRLVCAALTKDAVTLTIANQPYAVGDGSATCKVDYRSPDGSQYKSREAGIEAEGAFVGATLFFQPNGDITTDSAGTVYAVGVIKITGQPGLSIDGRTGYVQ